MSRAQETTATNTAAAQNAGYYTNAQNSYSNAQADAGKFENAIGTYAAANPYGQGGQSQTVTNQQLTNTADASSAALGTTLQGQALRTGQNTQGAVAATEAAQQQAQRTLGGQEAAATQQRIGAGAAYGQTVLNATGQAEGQQAQLAGQQAQAAGGALGEQVKASETPSWTDEFGNAIATSLGNRIGSGGRG
jgi:hypothetical protein